MKHGGILEDSIALHMWKIYLIQKNIFSIFLVYLILLDYFRISILIKSSLEIPFPSPISNSQILKKI